MVNGSWQQLLFWQGSRDGHMGRRRVVLTWVVQQLQWEAMCCLCASVLFKNGMDDWTRSAVAVFQNWGCTFR